MYTYTFSICLFTFDLLIRGTCICAYAFIWGGYTRSGEDHAQYWRPCLEITSTWGFRLQPAAPSSDLEKSHCLWHLLGTPPLHREQLQRCSSLRPCAKGGLPCRRRAPSLCESSPFRGVHHTAHALATVSWESLPVVRAYAPRGCPLQTAGCRPQPCIPFPGRAVTPLASYLRAHARAEDSGYGFELLGKVEVH